MTTTAHLYVQVLALRGRSCLPTVRSNPKVLWHGMEKVFVGTRLETERPGLHLAFRYMSLLCRDMA